MSEYPEHEKLKAIQLQSQKCGQFYEWLVEVKGVNMESSFSYERDEHGDKIWRDSDGNIVEEYEDPDSIGGWGSAKHKKMEKMRDERGMDCRLVPDPAGPISMPIRKTLAGLLAEFFEIDENKLEAEKRAMLEACRKAHATKNDSRL